MASAGPTASGRPDLIAHVIQAQAAILQALVGAQPLPEWAGHSLMLAQLTALFALFRSGPLPVGQPGAVLGLSKSAASLLVDALVRRGLVERHEDPRDRRRALTRLAPRGRSLISEHHSGSHQQFEAWLAELHPPELASLARGLAALASAACAGSARAAS